MSLTYGVLTEEAFRDLLDARGILRPGTLAAPDPRRAYVIFSQSRAVRLDIEATRRHAEQFFATKIGLTVDKRYEDVAPEVDAARLVVSSGDGRASGTRLCYGRAVLPSDVIAAEEAERAIGTYGLALLAKRCPTVWTVVPESDDDRAALTIAAILASTLLGPIVSPGGHEIIGVRSARLKLEGRASPYR